MVSPYARATVSAAGVAEGLQDAGWRPQAMPGYDLPGTADTPDDRLAAAISKAGDDAQDPVWRMPLWPAYDQMLDSKCADLNNVSSGGFAGSITAALYLKRFVTNTAAYAHFDIYGWVPSSKPGRPEGGDVQAARLMITLLARYFR